MIYFTKHLFMLYKRLYKSVFNIKVFCSVKTFYLDKQMGHLPSIYYF